MKRLIVPILAMTNFSCTNQVSSLNGIQAQELAESMVQKLPFSNNCSLESSVNNDIQCLDSQREVYLAKVNGLNQFRIYTGDNNRIRLDPNKSLQFRMVPQEMINDMGRGIYLSSRVSSKTLTRDPSTRHWVLIYNLDFMVDGKTTIGNGRVLITGDKNSLKEIEESNTIDSLAFNQDGTLKQYPEVNLRSMELDTLCNKSFDSVCDAKANNIELNTLSDLLEGIIVRHTEHDQSNIEINFTKNMYPSNTNINVSVVGPPNTDIYCYISNGQRVYSSDLSFNLNCNGITTEAINNGHILVSEASDGPMMYTTPYSYKFPLSSKIKWDGNFNPTVAIKSISYEPYSDDKIKIEIQHEAVTESTRGIESVNYGSEKPLFKDETTTIFYANYPYGYLQMSTSEVIYVNGEIIDNEIPVTNTLRSRYTVDSITFKTEETNEGLAYYFEISPAQSYWTNVGVTVSCNNGLFLEKFGGSDYNNDDDSAIFRTYSELTNDIKDCTIKSLNISEANTFNEFDISKIDIIGLP